MRKNIMLMVLAALFLSCSSTNPLADALRKGKNRSNFYEADFGKLVKKEMVVTWCKSKGYVLVSYMESEVARFGGYETGITGARFMERGDYVYMVEQERQRKIALARASERARSRREENSMVTLGAIVAGGFVAVKLLGELFDSSGSSSSSYSSYSNSSSSSSLSDVDVEVGEWKENNFFSGSMPANCEQAAKVKFFCPSGSKYSNKHVSEYIGLMSNGKYVTGVNVCGFNSAPKFNTFQEAVHKTIKCACDGDY